MSSDDTFERLRTENLFPIPLTRNAESVSGGAAGPRAAAGACCVPGGRGGGGPRGDGACPLRFPCDLKSWRDWIGAATGLCSVVARSF
jgi:hypothetical protein